MLQDAEKFRDESLKLDQDFEKVLGDFALLTGEFGLWAQDKKDDQKLKLEAVEKQIETLNAELKSLKDSLLGVGAAAALTLTLTGVIGLFAGPFAPFVIVSGFC